MQPGEHLADEILSASLDDQLTPAEASAARAHLETCSVCRGRLEELRSVVGLLRRLPSLEPPPRLFGLRLVADPPNVVRLRRWYSVARAGAASLAAVFVFASAGAVYVNSQPQAVPSSGALSAQSAPAAAPAALPAASPPAIAARSAAAPAPVAGAAADSAAAARPKTAPAPAGAEVADQTTATTSVRPLPTSVPTAMPALAPQSAGQPVAPARVDAAAPLWTAAAIAGVLAAFGLLAALLVRRRIHEVSNSVLE